MKLRDLLVCGFCLAAGVLFATAAAADRRVALVIGNSTYKNASSLPNTINDSTAIAALFKSVGFEVVISRTDLGVVDFKRAVREFLLTAENADIAVVYYAGHGVEIGGTNYLVPVDAKLGRDYDVEDEAVALDRIIPGAAVGQAPAPDPARCLPGQPVSRKDALRRHPLDVEGRACQDRGRQRRYAGCLCRESRATFPMMAMAATAPTPPR